MIKNLFKLAGVIIAIGLLFVGVFYWQHWRRPQPVAENPTENNNGLTDDPDAQPQPSLPGENDTGLPLKVPDNFKVEVFAKNLPGARVIAQDQLGNLWVSQTSAGTVSELEIKDGQVISQTAVFKGLKNPHGLAIDGLTMYVAEETKISKVQLYTEDVLHKIADLPSSGGGHFTRTLGIGPDGRLYVSIGSSCNVCNETDPRRAAIYSLNKDGSDFKSYAAGLRNSVFFRWSPVDGRMWATENSRDNLGDNVPPDEINIIEDGKNYGWPNCYGNNIHDTNFDKKTYVRNPCMEPLETPPAVELQAHSAALGLDFIPEEGWPESLAHNLIVAFHGSWNRTVPTGYKLVRVKLDAQGKYLGTEDFITGWQNGPSVLGRPVDVFARPGGLMYVSDDKAGVIYRISYIGH
jgi:glucose/arabinose dehydrogenase